MKQESRSVLIGGKEVRAPFGSPICSIYLAVNRWISGTFCKKHLEDKSPCLTLHTTVYGVQSFKLNHLDLNTSSFYLISLVNMRFQQVSSFTSEIQNIRCRICPDNNNLQTQPSESLNENFNQNNSNEAYFQQAALLQKEQTIGK